MLNIGCGTRMNWEWNNLDFSPNTYFVRHPKISSLLNKIGILSRPRYERLLKVDPEIIGWNVQKGLPFSSNVFDVIYHSHFLEHLDKDMGEFLLKECCRVLKPEGVLRIVIPDLREIIQQYMSSLETLEKGDPSALSSHQQSIDDLFSQMVRVEAAGAKDQHPFVRVIERFWRGDAARVGELHRWMYDQHSLGEILRSLGLKDIQVLDAFCSKIQDWSKYQLDINPDGSVYKPGSLYMEGVK